MRVVLDTVVFVRALINPKGAEDLELVLPLDVGCRL
jgi:predicted nucleic acid-binding protein